MVSAQKKDRPLHKKKYENLGGYNDTQPCYSSVCNRNYQAKGQFISYDFTAWKLFTCNYKSYRSYDLVFSYRKQFKSFHKENKKKKQQKPRGVVVAVQNCNHCKMKL